MKLVLLGAPGAGKGTQSAILSKQLNIPAISTGNILREAMKHENELGHRVKEFVNGGKLVPDDVIIGVTLERLMEDDCKDGFILDGMPRTIAQAEALENSDFAIDVVLSLDIEDEVIVERMAGRRVCVACGGVYHVVQNAPKLEGICDNCGGELSFRDDDAPATVMKRLEIFHHATKPLEEFYEKLGKLRRAQNQENFEKTTLAVKKALGL